jgi:hypothetical protein
LPTGTSPHPPHRTGLAALTASGSPPLVHLLEDSRSVPSHFLNSMDVHPWTACAFAQYLCSGLSTGEGPSPSVLLPKPGCRHPDSASKPDVKISLHPAPQLCGSCHEDHRTDGSRDCLSALHTYLGTGPGSCPMHTYSPPSLPHHRSHVSLSWALPQAFASWEIPPQPSHAADNLLHSGGEPWRGYAIPGSCVALRVGLHYTPGYLWDAAWITG